MAATNVNARGIFPKPIPKLRHNQRQLPWSEWIRLRHITDNPLLADTGAVVLFNLVIVHRTPKGLPDSRPFATVSNESLSTWWRTANHAFRFRIAASFNAGRQRRADRAAVARSV